MAINTSEYWFFDFFDILHSLTEKEKENVTSMSCRTNWTKKSVIYTNGDSANKLYFLKEGVVKVSKYSNDGKEMIVSIFKKGDVFGEESILSDNGIHTEVVEVMEDVLICSLSIVDVRNLLSTNLKFNNSILQLIGKRQDKIQKRLEALFFKTTPERVKGFIKDFALENGKKLVYSSQIEVKFSLTHEDIAKLTGTTRQTVTSILNKLQKDNIITYDRSRILIKEIDKL